MSKTALNRHVLVLNKAWVAIGTTTVKEAIILMSRSSAEGLCTASYTTHTWEEWVSDTSNLPEIKHFIKTPSLSIPAPEIIRLTNYGDVHRTVVKYSSTGIYRRDNYTCQYCKQRKKREDLSIDHVIPQSRGGKTSWLNCVAACFKCNNKKGDRTPQEAGFALARQPYRPNWNPVIQVRDELRPESWKKTGLVKAKW